MGAHPGGRNVLIPLCFPPRGQGWWAINTQDVTFNPAADPSTINLPQPAFSSDNGTLINDALLKPADTRVLIRTTTCINTQNSARQPDILGFLTKCVWVSVCDFFLWHTQNTFYQSPSKLNTLSVKRIGKDFHNISHMNHFPEFRWGKTSSRWSGFCHILKHTWLVSPKRIVSVPAYTYLITYLHSLALRSHGDVKKRRWSSGVLGSAAVLCTLNESEQ